MSSQQQCGCCRCCRCSSSQLVQLLLVQANVYGCCCLQQLQEGAAVQAAGEICVVAEAVVCVASSSSCCCCFFVVELASSASCIVLIHTEMDDMIVHLPDRHCHGLMCCICSLYQLVQLPHCCGWCWFGGAGAGLPTDSLCEVCAWHFEMVYSAV